MKTIFFKAIVIITVFLTGMISCEKNNTKKGDPIEGVKELLELKTRMNAMNAGSGEMSNFMSIIGYSQLKNGELSIEGTNSDTVYLDSICCDTVNYWEFFTCATVSEYDNNDGTHTTIYDYGDGCEEFGTLYKGKITYIWSNENNYYYSKVIYDHYYNYGVEMNGISEYSFTSDGNSFFSTGTKENEGDSTLSTTPVEFNWSGSSSGHEDITMVNDDGESYYYLSDYSNKWDSTSYTVLEGEYYYKSESDGYEYHYIVTEPLVTNYKCTDSWVPVSGIETITNTENGVTHSYSLNYGTGICDNLAELIENGNASVIDFGELYKIFNDGTGSNSPGNAGNGRK